MMHTGRGCFNLNLYELAFTCYIYKFSTPFNKAYKDLQETTGSIINVNHRKHRTALIGWLNKWGCRQFALKGHDEASEELLAWHQEGHIKKLPRGKKLWELNETELDRVTNIFDSLARKVASRPIRGDREIPRTFGPTGASKILFALRPNLAVPWDSYIRDNLGYSGNGSSYVEYLKRLIEEIEELKESCKENGHHLKEVPSIIGREGSTIPQLAGEYFWVIETKKCYPPERNIVLDWAAWSKSS